MLLSFDDHYLKLARPLLGATPCSTKTLQAAYRLNFPRAQTKLENVLAWLESHGYLKYNTVTGTWLGYSRANLATLADGLGFDYGVSVEEMRSTRPFGAHVAARAHLAHSARKCGWSFEEIAAFLGKSVDFVRNAAERFATKAS